MEQTWRWFGPDDPVSLSDVRQAGATGVVTALHAIPNGTVWPVEEILERKHEIEAAGLTWSVVESIPIHEDIKTGAPNWQRHAQAWSQSLRNLAECGISRICYNFMPVLDWTRTELDHCLPDGSRCLRFDHTRYVAFDVFILQRPGAEHDYSPAEINAAQAVFAAMSDDERETLTQTIIAGLPGSEESYSLDSFRNQLAAYDGLGAEGLRAQLAAFLAIVVPVAQSVGSGLAIHPDDPPRTLFGLPRVVSTFDDMVAIATMIDSPANGFTLCTGSYGVRADNDILHMIREFGPKIQFAHLRATKREENPLDFHEAPHLEGDVDMVSVIRALLLEERRRGAPIPFRPDHGHQILDDLRKISTPGYPGIGRLRGLAELRGVALAVDALI